VGLKYIAFDAVVEALEEHDRLGQEEFLCQYG
jgi:hypothetical protein